MTSSPRIARQVLAGAALTCVAAVVAACGSSSPSAGPAKTVTVTAPPAASASTGASTPASGSSPAAAAGAAACPTRALRAKVGIGQGTAGSVYTVLDFTNISQVSCTLYGYPGVSLAGGTPVTQIGLPAAENKATPRKLVTLAPGATGNALLQITDANNYATATCHPVTAHYLQIFPPNQTTPIYLAYTSLTCSKPVRTLTISVVQPGSGSSS